MKTSPPRRGKWARQLTLEPQVPILRLFFTAFAPPQGQGFAASRMLSDLHNCYERLTADPFRTAHRPHPTHRSTTVTRRNPVVRHLSRGHGFRTRGVTGAGRARSRVAPCRLHAQLHTAGLAAGPLRQGTLVTLAPCGASARRLRQLRGARGGCGRGGGLPDGDRGSRDDRVAGDDPGGPAAPALGTPSRQGRAPRAAPTLFRFPRSDGSH